MAVTRSNPSSCAPKWSKPSKIMSEEDDNMHNNEEYVENYEENENMEGMNQEEYDEENMNENGEDEAALDVYDFDI